MRRLVLTALAALLALGGGLSSAPPATADGAEDGYFLDLSGPTSAEVGTPLLLTATGTESHEYLNMYLDAYAIPRSIVTTCPASHDGALQLAQAGAAQGGEKFAYVVPAEGDFSVPLAYTAGRPGAFLICAYLNDLAWDGAWAQHDVTVTAPVTAPASLTRPRLTRSGAKLACSRGTWSGKPRSYSFGWSANGVRLPATTPTIKVTRRVRGTKVVCSVTARNDAGAQTARSNALKVR